MRTLLFILSFTLIFSSAVQAREPRLSPDNMVAVELVTVAMEPQSGSHVVLLREAQSGDVVPIFIGPEEARAIILAMESIATPRPMTHDTAAAVIRAMGGQLERVMVDALVGNSYYGLLDIRLQADPDTPIFVDSRPSDALALAVRLGAAILVAPEVLQSMRERDIETIDLGPRV
ncbi:bifunctional nuclease family protein [Salinispirillum sp. LH 10-3-1]|uniref:Bifunctional nuclease family protein n=1 Tax=Salinispirillum sp. LH 10-3-1 TaxID=2952525 RepID=A0AB38YJ02_9GAMM